MSSEPEEGGENGGLEHGGYGLVLEEEAVAFEEGGLAAAEEGEVVVSSEDGRAGGYGGPGDEGEEEGFIGRRVPFVGERDAIGDAGQEGYLVERVSPFWWLLVVG